MLRQNVLELGVAWKLQERVLGGLSAATNRQLAELARTMSENSDLAKARTLTLCGAARHFPFDFGREARIVMGVVGAEEGSEDTRARLAKRGALGGASAISASHQSEPPPMAKSRTSKVAQSNTKPSPVPTKKRVTHNERPPKPARAVAPTPPVPSRGPSQRATKQNACLRLLARPDGATIEDLQSATGWQSHSVRGFLAGAVKKKLGLTLVSSKADGDVRRYRVVDAGVRGR